MKLAVALCMLVLIPLDATAECADYQLFVSKDAPLRPLACTPSNCVDITVTPPAAKAIEVTPPPFAIWERGKACRGTTCRALGPRFSAELQRRSRLVSVARHHELEISFTTDHRIGVVTGPLPHPFEIWDIKRDARLAVKPSADHAKAQISVAYVVGSTVIVDWNDGLASIHDVNGQRGATFRAGLVAALDETRAAVIGWTGTVITLDLATGKVLRTDQTITGRIPFETDLLRIGPRDIALMWLDDKALTAVRIQWASDTPAVSPRQKLDCE